MRLKISHHTEYRYDAPVHYALQQLRLTPKSRGYQQVEAWHTTVTGGTTQAGFTDQHDNHVELVRSDPDTQELSIVSEGEVVTTDTKGIYGNHCGHVPLWLFMRPTDQTRPGPLVRKLADSVGGAGDGPIGQMHALSAAIAQAVTYRTGETHAGSTAEEALEAGNGVCQDHAHVFVSAARQLGLPARYVSGYLMMTDRVEQDASHAWAEVHVNALGWVGFDVSNEICPDERYVRVATGLDYHDAAPVSGMRLGESGESLTVTLQIQQQ